MTFLEWVLSEDYVNICENVRKKHTNICDKCIYEIAFINKKKDHVSKCKCECHVEQTNTYYACNEEMAIEEYLEQFLD